MEYSCILPVKVWHRRIGAVSGSLWCRHPFDCIGRPARIARLLDQIAQLRRIVADGTDWPGLAG